jgi:hypothetical protein
VLSRWFSTESPTSAPGGRHVYIKILVDARSLELHRMAVDGGMLGCTEAGGFIEYDGYFHFVNPKKYVIIYLPHFHCCYINR